MAKNRLICKLIPGGIAASIIASMPFMAAASLGISAGLAQNLYYVLQGVSWVGFAAAIIGGMGIGGAAAGGILYAVKRLTLKQFINW